jgi:segregation and condensation protein B
VTADERDLALRQGLEALLFLADEPLSVDVLAEVLERPPGDVEEAVTTLAASYRSQARGIEVRSAAGGWRMYTAAAARPVLERWALLGRTGRLTQAALETLAVVAYKQPITRQEIGDIRGVSADAAIRSLVARGFVHEVGREDGPGQPVLFGTTPTLLERLGLGSLDELPPLTDFLPESPAPDEPALGALKEVRRRLAAGEELPSRSLGGRSAAQTNTGRSDTSEVPGEVPGEAPGDPDGDPDGDLLPAPTGGRGRARGDEAMDELTERLEMAARNAVERLRVAVAAGDGAADDPDDALSDAGGQVGDGAADDPDDAPSDAGHPAPAGEQPGG